MGFIVIKREYSREKISHKSTRKDNIMREIHPIVRNRFRTLICVPNYEPELIVGNKLSKKPQEAAKKLKEIVEGKNSICKINPHSNALEYEGYDVKISQDYRNGTVTLGLSSWPNLFVSGDKWISQNQSVSTVLPATAAVKRYTKALKEMVENTTKETVTTTLCEAKKIGTTTLFEPKPKKKWYQFW